MVAALHHLWWQIVQGAAQRLAAAIGCMHAPPKVGDLQLALDSHQQVLRFYVAVDHVLQRGNRREKSAEVCYEMLGVLLGVKCGSNEVAREEPGRGRRESRERSAGWAGLGSEAGRIPFCGNT